MKTALLLAAIAIFCASSFRANADEPPAIPDGGVPILTASNMWVLIVQSNGAKMVTYQRQTVSAGPIVQCKISELATSMLWRTSCDMRFTNAFSRGDVVLITGRARVLETTNSSGRGEIRCVFRFNEKPYDQQFKVRFEVGKEWSRFFFPAALNFDIPAGKGVAIFNLGYAIHMVELCDVQIYRYPPGFDVQNLPKTEFTVFPR